MSISFCRERKETGPDAFQALPAEVLCQIISHLKFHDKLRLQLVCKKVHGLLRSPPPGEGLWGECHLSGDIRCIEEQDFIDPIVRRWFLTRVPYMTRISCDTASAKGGMILRVLVPCLNHLIAPAAVLCVDLDDSMLLTCPFSLHPLGHTWKLLRPVASWSQHAAQPDPAIINFWHTLSERLAELNIHVNWTYHSYLPQPQLLKQLTALTKMSFHVKRKENQDCENLDWTLDIPELRELHLEQYSGRDLALECSKLTTLTLVERSKIRHVYLQASLQGLSARSSSEFRIHPGFRIHAGFPVSNLMGLVSLSIECHADDENVFLSALPMMHKLRTLDIVINQGWLLQGLPESLHEVTLQLTRSGWDNAINPVLQQVVNLKDLKISIQRYGEDALATLSCDLRPFMAMEKLCTFQLDSKLLESPRAI